MSERVGQSAEIDATTTADTDYQYGAAVPEPDGWINPHRVSTTGTRDGAVHRCQVIGGGAVVVRRRITEWEVA